MKKVLKILGCCAGILVLLAVILMFLPEEESAGTVNGDTEEFYGASEYAGGDYRISTAGTGAESATVMVYIIGSDLESEGGCASDDIGEMLEADLGDNLNIVLQTGGAFDWKDPMEGSQDRWG